ncbi:MAG: PIN domain-containing protein [Wenzhouxiangella sp.]|nr:MAG: PIN domain-containing protein [Wenzhouxiangella sp.]
MQWRISSSAVAVAATAIHPAASRLRFPRNPIPRPERSTWVIRIRCSATGSSKTEEVLYRVWKDEDELAGRLALQQCLALPMEWVEATDDLLLQAAGLKARFPISVVDAWIAAAALRLDAVLVHKDPEFETLPVKQEQLPLKPPGEFG